MGPSPKGAPLWYNEKKERKCHVPSLPSLIHSGAERNRRVWKEKNQAERPWSILALPAVPRSFLRAPPYEGALHLRVPPHAPLRCHPSPPRFSGMTGHAKTGTGNCIPVPVFAWEKCVKKQISLLYFLWSRTMRTRRIIFSLSLCPSVSAPLEMSTP